MDCIDRLGCEVILDETIDWIREHGRCHDGRMCRYYFDDKMCAVGRCLVDPVGFPHRGGLVSFMGELDPLLKPQYRGHSRRFWEDLQTLHDRSRFWGNGDLTDEGKDYVQTMKDKYAHCS